MKYATASQIRRHQRRYIRATASHVGLRYACDVYRSAHQIIEGATSIEYLLQGHVARVGTSITTGPIVPRKEREK